MALSWPRVGVVVVAHCSRWTHGEPIKAPRQRADVSFFFSAPKRGSGELPHTIFWCISTFLSTSILCVEMGPKSGFKKCTKCTLKMSCTNPHNLCLQCLGPRHDTASCEDCQALTLKTRREREQKLALQWLSQAPRSRSQSHSRSRRHSRHNSKSRSH